MFKTSHLQELKRRYASMYAPPVEEKVIEDGTIEGVEQYKKDTPGQDIEKEFKEHCGVCGEEDEKESIEEKYVIKHRKNKNRYLSNKAMDASNVKDALKFKSEKEAKNTLNGLDWQFRSNYEIVKEEEENVLDEAKNIKTVKLIVSPKPDATKTHAILLKMFPQENRNDLWDLARNMEDVGATLKEGTALQVKMALDDAGLKGKWKNNKVYVKKRDVKKAEKALKGNVIYRGKPPVVVGEEIEEAHKVECPKCKGEGCEHCDGKGYHIKEAKGTAFPATVDTLRKIVKDKQHQTVMFKSGQALVDLFTASAMVQVYDALKKPEMKKHFEKMITDKAGFLKTQAFAMKMIGK